MPPESKKLTEEDINILARKCNELSYLDRLKHRSCTINNERKVKVLLKDFDLLHLAKLANLLAEVFIRFNLLKAQGSIFFKAQGSIFFKAQGSIFLKHKVQSSSKHKVIRT